MQLALHVTVVYRGYGGGPWTGIDVTGDRHGHGHGTRVVANEGATSNKANHGSRVVAFFHGVCSSD